MQFFSSVEHGDVTFKMFIKNTIFSPAGTTCPPESSNLARDESSCD